MRRAHAGVIATVNLRFPAYGPATQVAKRWIAAHMLSLHFNGEVIELLMAYLFLHPGAFEPPTSREVAFVRFLDLLASHPWNVLPLFVDPAVEEDGDARITADAMQELEKNMDEPDAPSMCIWTPYDSSGDVWTRNWTRRCGFKTRAGSRVERRRASQSDLAGPQRRGRERCEKRRARCAARRRRRLGDAFHAGADALRHRAQAAQSVVTFPGTCFVHPETDQTTTRQGARGRRRRPLGGGARGTSAGFSSRRCPRRCSAAARTKRARRCSSALILFGASSGKLRGDSEARRFCSLTSMEAISSAWP